jgi:hypothetical protein
LVDDLSLVNVEHPCSGVDIHVLIAVGIQLSTLADRMVIIEGEFAL